jgi:hypothetical protein
MDELYGVRIKKIDEKVIKALVTEISTIREEISQIKDEYSELSHDNTAEFAEEETAVFPLDLITDEPVEYAEPEAVTEEPAATDNGISSLLLDNIKSVLLYMDKLLESLPEAKITEFANSDYFRAYRNVFQELGLTQKN